MSGRSHSLEQIQRWMQTVVMHPQGAQQGIASEAARQHVPVGPAELGKVVTRSRALTEVERLEIYHRAYYTRLIECLEKEFPVLAHALGKELFDQFALAYLQHCPSRSYTLSDLGANFPRFLEETQPDTSAERGVRNAESGDTTPKPQPETETGHGSKGGPPDWPRFIIDIARLERAVHEVFDGPGAENESLLDAEQFLTVSKHQWADLQLVPVPCLRLLAFRWPVNGYFTAVRRKLHDASAPEPAMPAAEPSYVALSRRQYTVRRYELKRVQYILLDALVRGKSIGEAVELAAHEPGVDLEQFAKDLRVWFRLWAAEGFFRAAKLPG